MTSQWMKNAPRAGRDLPESTLSIEREKLRVRPVVVGSAGVEDKEAIVQRFKKAMRRHTATVSIIATREHGFRYGMAATAISAVCTDPPALLICINRTATLYQPLMRTQRFSVNLLHEDHADLIGPFSGKLAHEARFLHGAWQDLHGLPVLDDAQATLFCEVDGELGYGSHDVVIGRVVAVAATGEVAPLLWQDGGHAVARALPTETSLAHNK